MRQGFNFSSFFPWQEHRRVLFPVYFSQKGLCDNLLATGTCTPCHRDMDMGIVTCRHLRICIAKFFAFHLAASAFPHWDCGSTVWKHPQSWGYLITQISVPDALKMVCVQKSILIMWLKFHFGKALGSGISHVPIKSVFYSMDHPCLVDCLPFLISPKSIPPHPKQTS